VSDIAKALDEIATGLALYDSPAAEHRVLTFTHHMDARTGRNDWTGLTRADIEGLVAALRAVLDLHREAEMFEVDLANGVWVLDENGEKRRLPSICEHCTPEDTNVAIEDNCWDDSMETVYYPCATRKAITSALTEAGR